MWAIVPIKTFEMAKQRLANVLSASERKSLMLAMARDVLTALSSSNLLDHILIVSRAPEADALAQAFNTERFSETPSASLADALEQATHHLVNNFNADGVFVVPADVPGVNAEELDTLISKMVTTSHAKIMFCGLVRFLKQDSTTISKLVWQLLCVHASTYRLQELC